MGTAAAASQLRKPWAPYEESNMLEYEGVFHALVDLVWEKVSLKTPTSFINIHPRRVDDRRHIATYIPFGVVCFRKAKCYLSDCLTAIEQA